MAMRTHPNGPVRLGLIGCGWVVQNCHLPALHALPDVRVVAVADTNRDLLDQVADRFHIERRYTSHQALLDDQSLEAVAICVPTQHHVDVALPAIDAGKHIFIEKPLALSLHDCDRLMERASQSTSKILLGFNMRWHRLVRQARSIVQQGELGPLLAIRSVYSSCARHPTGGPEWVKRRELGGGVLVEQAVHHFDAWRFLLQCEIEEVYAATRSDQRDDTAGTVTARFTNGVLACGLFSQSTSNNNELEIYGQSGRLQVSCYRFDGLDHFSKSDAPGSLESRLRSISQSLRGLTEGVRNLRHGGGFMASYRAEWRHFFDGIRYDKPMECTLEDGRRALQVVLAAVASADSWRPVKIEQAPEKIEG
jgi:myo-inositol 2-dehydrogenase / D-chiro-inositol 1-dehydrogenase